jgi:replicative DNA helicase
VTPVDLADRSSPARERSGARPRPAASGRIPPHNLQAEESVLGAILLSREALGAVVEAGLRYDDFYKPAHQHIFDVAVEVSQAGAPVDTITVAEGLERHGLLEQCGGVEALHALQNATPAISNAASYARIVQDAAMLRRLILVAADITELGYSRPDSVEDALDEAETRVFRVADRRVADTYRDIGELMKLAVDRIEENFARGDTITGVATGFNDLDELLSGLQPSTLNIVGARPSMGKTAFGLGIATHVAKHSNVPVLVFSLEMGHVELTQRILSSEAEVDSQKIRNGRLSEADWAKIGRAIGRLEVPLFLDDNPRVTVMEIRAKARRLKMQHGVIGLIVVDYLQLMSSGGNPENRQLEVSEISRNLKILARELEVPILALSQLSRNLESRSDKHPMLSDLRESGCVTADTRLLRADTNAEVTIGELVKTGATNVPVWSLDRDLRMVPAKLTRAFPSGVKEVFSVRLASGRTVKASANHPLLTVDGWKRLDELAVGSRIAVPRVVPEPLTPLSWPDEHVILLAHLLGDGCFASRQPLHYTSGDPANIDAVEKAAVSFGIQARRVAQRSYQHLYLSAGRGLARGRRNPIAAWLDELGLYGLRSHEKFIPREVFGLTRRQVALFLHHLWATDGSLGVHKLGDGDRSSVYYASTSRRLVEDLQLLLSRFGLLSRIVMTRKGNYRPGYQLTIAGSVSMRRFLDDIGVHGARGERVPLVRERLGHTTKDAYCDALPEQVSERVEAAVAAAGLSHAEVARRAGLGRYRIGRAPVPRWRLERLAAVLDQEFLRMLATSDVHWDRVVEISSLGVHAVYDATVAETHNFVANGITLENSLEQDADVVMFLYRDEVYNKDSPDRGAADVIVAKHRAGPTGVLRLVFRGQYARFDNAAPRAMA